METLITGNVLYWSEKTIRTAFGQEHPIICGSDCKDRRDSYARWFQIAPTEDSFRRIFLTYGFERIVYVSHELDYQRGMRRENEAEELRRVLRLCREMPVKQFIYLASDRICSDDSGSADIILKSFEDTCAYYAQRLSADLKIIRCPYLTCEGNPKDYWQEVFRKLAADHTWEFKKAAQAPTNFMDMDDLAEFLYRLFDDWKTGTETIGLQAAFRRTFQEAAESLKMCCPDAQITFSGNLIADRIEQEDHTARDRYGWFARTDVIGNLPKYWAYFESRKEKRRSLPERIRNRFHMRSRNRMILELILGSIAVEILNKIAGNSVQFRMIDIRLLFVVLMATVYGTAMGTVTALVEVGSLIWAYYRQGSNWMLLFYDPGNWLPFILLMVTGAVCGYVRQKKDEEVRFVKEENDTLTSRNVFISELYEEAMEYKNRYKQDLLGSRDGFGRIFDVVKKLSTIVPEQIFAQSVPVMEDVLNNHSIAIYTINDESARFARLQVSSQKISGSVRKSLKLEDYPGIIQVLRTGELWINKNPEEGVPSYIAGISSEGALSVMISVYDVSFLQMNTYYANLIRILSGLMENFIVKAWEYQKAVQAQIYIEGTNIVNPEYLEEQIRIQQDMVERQNSSYRLIRINGNGRNIAEIDELLRAKVRDNDTVGLGKDNNIYIICAQVDESSEQIVLGRFKNMGFDCSIVKKTGEQQ